MHKAWYLYVAIVGEEGYRWGHVYMPKSHWHIGPRDVKYDTFDQAVSLLTRRENCLLQRKEVANPSNECVNFTHFPPTAPSFYQL